MDPAGSGTFPRTAMPVATVKELDGRAARSGGAAEEACGSRPAVALGDLRVGTSELSDQVQVCLHPCGKKDTPQFTTEGATKCEDGLASLPRAGALLQPEAACLTFCRASGSVLPGNLHGPDHSACGKENSREDLQPKPDTRLGLDLNIVDSSDVQELNPFFPYKKLGQSKVSYPSECGSSTGATGESESYRKWREMKKNRFLSSSLGTAVVPKPRGRHPKRKRDDEKRSTHSQNEHTNKFTKVAAPSGLLSELNPGIINHVRNSKQVYSIIKAMVHPEKLQDQSQPVFASQTGERGIKDSGELRGQKYGGNILKDHFMMEGNNAALHHGRPTTSKFLPEDGDNQKLQLSSTVTMASDRTCSTSADDPESKHDYMTMLSVKSASVASQWLELLQQDLRGRLAALKRSTKRVRNAQTELPYLTSTEFSSHEENKSSIAHSSEAGSTDNIVSEAHAARWRSLFVQMDRTLQEEGRHLESRLKEVQEMLLNCDKGLKHMTCEAPLLGPMAELWKLKNTEISESEWAVQAAAASIYSTCSLVMKTEKVPCF